MSEQENGIGRVTQVEPEAETEVPLHRIQTNFVIEDAGLGSNLPEINAHTTRSGKTNRATFWFSHGNVREVVQRLDELGIGITAASFNLDEYRDNPGQTSQDKI